MALNKTQKLFKNCGLIQADLTNNFPTFIMEYTDIKPAVNKLYQKIKNKQLKFNGNVYTVYGVCAYKTGTVNNLIKFDVRFALKDSTTNKKVSTSDFDWLTGMVNDVWLSYATLLESNSAVTLDI
jgi:hypothetical protein